MAENEKFVTTTGLKSILQKLYDWLPFSVVKKSNTSEVQFGKNNETIDVEDVVFSIGVGTDETAKNAFDVRSNGDIYIYSDSKGKVRLQTELESTGSGVDMSMSGYNGLKLNENEDGEPLSNDTYVIKEEDTIKVAIKKLDERSDSVIVEKTSYLNFPTIGKRGVKYRDTSTGIEYIWDSVNLKYVRSSANVILGGGASDFSS